MKKINYPKLNETIYFEQLDNGLSVYLLPKKGFNRTYVTLSTKLGSVVGDLYKDNQKIEIPMGIAHFLEHKLFDQEGSDVSLKFALNQAQVNAFTQHNRTTYLFSCTDHLDKNIATLLDFVLHPIFTKEGIEKEKGIITQEIKMYEDNANTVSYVGLLKNMYKEHPVREDILGTVDSIKKIDKEKLDFIHSVFYNPKNMVLFATGHLDVEQTMQTIKKNVAGHKDHVSDIIVTDVKAESYEVNKKTSTVEKDIIMPSPLLGIKLPKEIYQANDIMKKELIISILMDLLFGKSSDLYKDFLSKGYINDTFGMDITLDETYGYIMIGSDTYYPDELLEELLNIFRNLNQFIIDPVAFKRTKKQVVGGFIHALNSLEYIAHQFTNYHYLNTSLFSVLDVASEITIDDIKNIIPNFTKENSYSTIKLQPKK